MRRCVWGRCCSHVSLTRLLGGCGATRGRTRDRVIQLPGCTNKPSEASRAETKRSRLDIPECFHHLMRRRQITRELLKSAFIWINKVLGEEKGLAKTEKT